MKITSDWVNEWLGRTILNDEQIVTGLERAGMEVEEVVASAEIDKLVVVAMVKKVVQHSAADRLHLVFVTTGEHDFRIVCGAHNVRVGLKVALAQIGAILPGGEKIGEAKLRGEVSQGMLCSERELGLGKDHDGILELPVDAEVGASVQGFYPAHTVIDIKTPANRFDVLSVLGLAREVAAMSEAKLAVSPVTQVKVHGLDAPKLQANVEAARYMLARFTVEASGATPAVVAGRLQAVGMRPLSPVVDVTNYVMFDIGQPLHAFDADKVKLPVDVRRAEAGEMLTTLDGMARKLTSDDLVISDATGPIALAGVMGGVDTEVTAGTREILLEAAVFDGATVRKMAQRHGLRTEASARFERGLPVELPELAVARAEKLLKEMAGGKLVAVSDQQNEPMKATKIEIVRSRAAALIGVDLSSNDIVRMLEKLQIEATIRDGDIVVASMPWWRPDLKLAEDVIEEVVRVLGYENVPSTLPVWRPRRVVFDRERAKRRQVRDVLYGAGLFEVATYSFVSEEQLELAGMVAEQHLKLKNPLSQEQAYLRSSLLASQLAVLARNRNYAETVGFYELSTVFLKRGKGEQPDEPLRLAVTLRRPRGALVQLKGVLDALVRELNAEVAMMPGEDARFVAGRSGEVAMAGQPAGWIGQVHPAVLQDLKIGGEVAYVEIDVAPLFAAARPKQFVGVAKFPKISRDVTVEVPLEVTWQAVSEAAAPAAAAYVSEYTGEGVPAGQKALTLRLVVERADRTPTEGEAAEVESALRSRLARKLGAVVRD